VIVRDTGWVDLIAGAALRDLTAGSMYVRRIAHAEWEWRVCGVFCAHFPEHDAEGVAGSLDDAKRAAEDALRKLCRDTLAALGDGE